MRYDGDFDHAHSRIRSTYVFAPGRAELVYVSDSYSGDRCSVTPFDGMPVNLPFADLAFATPRLNAVNTDRGSAFYATRMAVRGQGYRQGLRSSQFTLSTSDRQMGFNSGGDWIRNHWAQVNRSLRGQYDPLQQTLAALEEWATFRAISPNFFVNAEFGVYYRGNQHVGRILHNDTIELFERFGWLREQLLQEMGENILAVNINR